MEPKTLGSPPQVAEAVPPLMLVLARESRGLTQGEVAEKAGISQATLSKVENGVAPVTDDLIARLAPVLHYPREFFFQPLDFRNLPVSFFRKRVQVPMRSVHMIRAKINIIRLNVMRLLRSAQVPECRVPVFDLADYRGNAENIAREVRLRLNIPPGPIDNLTARLEAAGVLIVECPFFPAKVDGISLHEPSSVVPPMIFINPTIPGDRMRFTLAHELAHMVMHSHDNIDQPNMEEQANKFAAEFLMPALEIGRYLTRVTLQRLAQLKTHWRVAMSALLKRAGDLGHLTPNQSRRLFMEMGRCGYRTSEPNPVAREKATLLDELLHFHATLGYSMRDLHKMLFLELDDFRAQYAIHASGLHVVR